MAEFPTHKRLKDMTDKELQAFRDELRRRAAPEEWAAFIEFAGVVADFAAVWNSDEVKAARGAASQVFEGLRDFVPILLEELEKEPDAAQMDVTELVQSPKWDIIVDRASARLEAEGKQIAADVKDVALIASQKIASYYPRELVFPTSNEATQIFGGMIKPASGSLAAMSDDEIAEALQPVNAGKKNKRMVQNSIAISFSELQKDNIIIEHLEPVDEAIHNAALSVWLAGNAGASIPMVYRALVKNPKARVTEEWAKIIKESLERMRKTDIIYDNTASAAAFGQAPHRDRANLIYAVTREIYRDTPTEDTVYINGKAVDFYIVFIEFPLFKWASDKNQIARHDIAMLASGVNKNRTTVVLEQALLKRITAMPRISTTILYDTLFEDAKLLTKPDGSTYKENSLKVRKSKLKDYARRILDSWKQTGFIKGYTEEMEGKTAVKVKIQK
jgi:hypothetical protein